MNTYILVRCSYDFDKRHLLLQSGIYLDLYLVKVTSSYCIYLCEHVCLYVLFGVCVYVCVQVCATVPI